MKNSGKLIFAAIVLSFIALFSNFVFGREVIPMVKEDMKVWVGHQSQGARDWLSREEMEIMVSLMKTQKKAESGDGYEEFVLAFGATENDMQAMNMSLYRLTNGTNEFMMKYPDGSCYHVATRQVLQLLTSETLDNLLAYIEDAPTMTVTQGENSVTVHCVENGWQYKKIDNAIFMDGVIVKDPTKLVAVEDYTDLSLSFSTEPQSVRIKIELPATGQTVFEGTDAELAQFDPPYTGTYLMTVTARWNESGLQSYSGVCVYTAEIALKKATAGYLSAQEILPGELLVITVTNPELPETLRLVTDLAAGTFTRVGEGTYQCLVAADEPGQYPITVRAAGYRDDFTVTVGQRPEKEPLSEGYALSKSGEELQSYENLRRYFGDIFTADRYWIGAFAPATELSADVEFDRTFANGPELVKGSLWWKHTDVAAVKAVNTGVVVYAGATDETGLTVVVDHGLGLYSWYYGLSDLMVSQGSVVITGDTIGIVSPQEDEPLWSGLQVLLGNTPVDPQVLMEKAIMK